MKALNLNEKDASDYRKLPILTKGQLKRFRELGCQCESQDPMIVVKHFAPVGSSNWYATEFNEKSGVFYGLYTDNLYEGFTLWDIEFLRLTKLPLGMRIERDKWFKETNISKISERLFKYRNTFMSGIADDERGNHYNFGYSLNLNNF